MARLSGLDRATVTKRLAEVPITKETRKEKLYALKHALPALLVGADKEMDEAKLRKTQAEAKLKEHELAVERGEYVSVHEVESQFVKEYQWLNNRLLAQFPRDAASNLYKAESAAQISEILKHDLGRILNEWREL
ncbi:MAG TPA: hypothetical protein VF735_06635 [Pyrinomonadaceae bacterium]